MSNKAKKKVTLYKLKTLKSTLEALDNVTWNLTEDASDKNLDDILNDTDEAAYFLREAFKIIEQLEHDINEL